MYACVVNVKMQTIAKTGTVFNPRRFVLRIKAINALLSLFDIQEKVTSQVQMFELKSGGSRSPDEDNTALINVQTMLENLIKDTCNYVSSCTQFIS